MSLLFSRATDDDYVAHSAPMIYNVTFPTIQVILSVPFLYLNQIHECVHDYLNFLHDFLSSAK